MQTWGQKTGKQLYSDCEWYDIVVRKLIMIISTFVHGYDLTFSSTCNICPDN